MLALGMVLACLGGALYQSLHFTVNIMTKMTIIYDDDYDQDVCIQFISNLYVVFFNT